MYDIDRETALFAARRRLLGGRMVAVAWAAFWLFFSIAGALFGATGAAGGIVFLAVVFLLAATILLLFRHPAAGAILLVIEGFASLLVALLPGLLALGAPTRIFLFLVLALPPLVAGWLVVDARRRLAAAPDESP
ncbi:MAG: hypothetical protein JW876_06775 [Candidatus Krumholzibacteriota bacterium]|nr:hypothetical protein [Candidatus Krumholzibacteriota bacterium]